MINYPVLLEDLDNNDTLNIFTDASMCNSKGSYGAIAVLNNNIIDSIYYGGTDTTINACEAKGVRCGLTLAFRYINKFKFINIFSDSLLTVRTLKEFIFKWFYNPKTGLLYNSSGVPAANQSIHIENYLLYKQLLSMNNNVNLFHQNGHVDPFKDNSIKKCISNFIRFNNYPFNSRIDFNMIKYISLYNNIIDNQTRFRLKDIDDNKVYKDPFIFTTNKQIKRY